MYTSIQLISLTILVFSSYAIRNGQASDHADLEKHHLFKTQDCHRPVKATDIITVHYKGYLLDGQVFDSSYERNTEFSFQIGLGKVIPGWDKGLLGTCAGDKIKLVIPPHLGYGDVQNDKIPAGSTLTFEIEVLKVEDGPIPMNIFKEIDTDNDDKISRKEMIDYVKLQEKHAREQGDTAMADDPDQMDMIEEIFMHEDKDKDGMISHEEFMGPKHDHDEL